MRALEWLKGLDPRAKLACLAAFVVAALHARTFWALAASVAAAVALAWAVRLGRRQVAFVLKPLAPVLVITGICQVFYFQQGDVLAWLGPVALTREALAEVGRMVAGLLAIMLASVSFMRCTTTDELVQTLRWLLRPLAAAGLRTDAFMFSLSVAFRFVPVLVGDFRQLKNAQMARAASFEGGVGARVAAYARLFAPLVRSSLRRADTLAEASVARGLCCGVRATSLRAPRFRARDGVALVACALLAAAMMAL